LVNKLQSHIQNRNMKTEDLVIGAKYVPHQKTVDGYSKLDESILWQDAIQKNQHYLYYTGTSTDWQDLKVYCFSDKFPDDLSGDFFNPEDVTPYIEPIEEVSGKDLTQDARNFLTKKYGADFKNNNGIIKGANFWEGIVKEMVEFANIQKEQTKALQESHDELLETLKEAYKELKFHNWHNSTTGYQVTTAIENAKKYTKSKS